MDDTERNVINRTPKTYHHLQAIDFFESLAEDIETKHEGKIWTDLDTAVRRQYRIATTSSIIRAIAFLDATANEMLYRLATDSDDLIDFFTHPRLRRNISESEAQQLIKKQLPTLEKFDVVLSKSGCSKISRGEGVGQRTNYVVEFRNYLVHHEARPTPTDELPEKLSSLPRGVRFSNPFKTGPVAPVDKCLSTTTIAWAADTCFEYAEEFFNRLDIESDIPDDARSLDGLHTDVIPARPYVIGLDDLEHQYR